MPAVRRPGSISPNVWKHGITAFMWNRVLERDPGLGSYLNAPCTCVGPYCDLTLLLVFEFFLHPHLLPLAHKLPLSNDYGSRMIVICRLSVPEIVGYQVWPALRRNPTLTSDRWANRRANHQRWAGIKHGSQGVGDLPKEHPHADKIMLIGT